MGESEGSELDVGSLPDCPWSDSSLDMGESEGSELDVDSLPDCPWSDISLDMGESEDSELDVDSLSDCLWSDDMGESEDSDGDFESDRLRREQHVQAEPMQSSTSKPSGPDKEPLYEGAKLTLFDSCVLLLQFVLRFQLSGVAFEALLKLVSAHLPGGNHAAGSMYKLRKFCSRIFPDIKSSTRFYCKRCYVPLQSSEQCSRCGTGTQGRFIVGDIGSQLREKFKDPVFCKGLQDRPVATGVTIKDIHDGLEYQQCSRPGGFLCKYSNPANVSFTLNTDGVALFKSSSTDIWPVFLSVNELPPLLRFSKKYLILAGLWYGNEKPFMLTYLQPIVDQLNHLFNQGIEVVTSTGSRLTCRTMVLLCSTDLPARALVLNMKMYNGLYGCCTCTDPGAQGSCPSHCIWPFNEDCVIRTRSDTFLAIQTAVQEEKTVMGYKGFPVLASHQPFHVVKGVVVDYLHCVLLGVVKTLLNIWLDTSHRAQEYYIGNKTKDLDQGLSSIKVPDIIKRPPRSLKERKHWKGTEWQYWLLFYSLPLLNGLLPSTYFLHYCALVCGIAILLGDNISQQDLHKAQLLLTEFCRHAGDLYGFGAQTMNVHMLTHLTFHVRNWGPLWSYSCFSFESVNGQIRKLFHGTRDMSEQMLFTFSVVQSLPHAKMNLSPYAQSFAAKIDGESKRCGRKTFQYNKIMFRIGNSKVVNLGGCISTLLHSVCSFTPKSVLQFWRLQLKSTLYYSQEYSQSHSTNSYTISFGKNDQYGVIQYFLEVKNGDDEVFVFAVVDVQRVIAYHNLPHLYVSQCTGVLQAVAAGTISGKCVSMAFPEEDKSYIGVFPSQHLPYIT